MPASLPHLFQNNRAWAKQLTAEDPAFFERLSGQQSPEYLWIGCADSRVPANDIVGLMPGELFVHRNVANVVVHTDLNCLSVIQYAVEVLKVKHIMVVGHYGCGGVRAALERRKLGLIDNWLRHIQDVANKHEALLAREPNDVERLNRLCELNVMEQVVNVAQTTVIQGAWDAGQAVSVHGWIYSVRDGLLRDLGVSLASQADLDAVYVRSGVLVNTVS